MIMDIGMKGLVMGRISVFMVGRLFIGYRAFELNFEVVHIGREGIYGMLHIAQIIFEGRSIRFDGSSIIFEARIIIVKGRNIGIDVLDVSLVIDIVREKGSEFLVAGEGPIWGQGEVRSRV
jgi:hypothetical protein